MANSISMFIPAICLAIIHELGCNIYMVVTLICVCVFFIGVAFSGFLNPNVIDLAPTFAGTLFGITNTFSNLSGFIAPQVAVYFIEDREASLSAWSSVWLTSMIIACVGGVFYALTASGDKQPWNDRKMDVASQLIFEKEQFISSIVKWRKRQS